MQLKSNKIARALGFKARTGYLLGGCAVALNTLLAAPVVLAQDDSARVEEIVVTARFREENLQETPLAITSISGEALEERGIEDIVDLGLAIPNAQMRISPGQWGPNPTIGMRGVSSQEFIYTAEPGVGIYVDDVYHGTLTGSNLDLLDLERVEVLRGPQGTLFGKNSLGGTIRMISKAPQGDETGNVSVVVGTANRLDLKGSFDTALIDDTLFMRVSGASKQIDGFQDRLDFTCQMTANGTPGLAGTFPAQIITQETRDGNCKLGENGGSESNAARVMFRYLPTDRLEINLAADYSKTIQDPGAELLLSRYSPTLGFGSDGSYDVDVTQVAFGGLSATSDDRFLSTQDYNYATYRDPISGLSWETDQITEAWSTSLKIDYDISESVHVKVIGAYRTYDSNWTSDGDLTPLDIATATTNNIQQHDQTTFEIQFSGLAMEEKLEWTAGAYYYDSESALGGYVSLPAFNSSIIQNDAFTTSSESLFAHAVYDISDQLSANFGIRYTDEEKTYDFDHRPLSSIDKVLAYGDDHVDWKLSLDYQMTDATLVYGLVSTGFRSESANPRPFTDLQLTKFSGEEITAYEVGVKTEFFDNRVLLNTAIFINDYNPRLVGAGGSQCDLFDLDQPVWRDGDCPAGTTFAGGGGFPWFAQEAASGTAKGAEFELTWHPIDDLSINGSWGYYDYESDADVGEVGYLAPGVLLEAEHSFSFGAQYMIALDSGASLVPRLDWFFQGERTNGNVTAPQRSENIVPDYSLVNARLTYSSPDGNWSGSLVASNLLDEEYWIQLGAEYDTDGTLNNGRKGNPGRGREISLTLRRSF